MRFYESEYSVYPASHIPLELIILQGERSEGNGLWFQAGMTYFLGSGNSGIEFGCRVIKSEFDVDGDYLSSIYAYNNENFTSIRNLSMNTVTPFIAFKETEISKSSNFINSIRVGLGLRFYKYESYEIQEKYDGLGNINTSLVKRIEPYKEGPKLAILMTIGIGRGKRIS